MHIALSSSLSLRTSDHSFPFQPFCYSHFSSPTALTSGHQYRRAQATIFCPYCPTDHGSSSPILALWPMTRHTVRDQVLGQYNGSKEGIWAHFWRHFLLTWQAACSPWGCSCNPHQLLKPFAQIPKWVPLQWETPLAVANFHTLWCLLFLPSSLFPSPLLLSRSIIPKSGTPKLLPWQCKCACHEGEVGSAWEASNSSLLSLFVC